MSKSEKGGDRTGDEAAETGLWIRAAGADRNLGSRLWVTRQRLQDGRWRPAGMDACLDRRSKTGMRVENKVRRAVQISLRVADGRGIRDMESEGGGSRKQSNIGTGFKIRCKNSNVA